MVTDRVGRVQRASRGLPPCLTLLLQMRMLGLRGADPHFPGPSSWIGARPFVLSPTWPKASGSLSESGGHGQGGLEPGGLGAWDLWRQSWVESRTGFSLQRILLLAQA